jgi:hypothetical protein
LRRGERQLEEHEDEGGGEEVAGDGRRRRHGGGTPSPRPRGGEAGKVTTGSHLPVV